jgi:signal transduction histidine kinase
MSYWLRGKKGGALAFAGIVLLVAGGMGWVTAAVLRLEADQFQAQARAEQDERLRLALWRLDSLVSPVLAREDSRPYDHYSAIHAPAVVLQNDGKLWPPGMVLEPSPLLSADLPDWMLLHFQADAQTGWTSPEVLSPVLAERLHGASLAAPLRNVTPDRKKLLARLQGQLSTTGLLALVQPQGTSRSELRETALLPGNNDLLTGRFMEAQGKNSDYTNRALVQSEVRKQAQTMPQKYDPSVALENTVGNGANWLTGETPRSGRGREVTVTLGPMTPLWLMLGNREEQLLLARRVQIGAREICQGIMLDWPRLRDVLGLQVHGEFPQVQFHSVHGVEPQHPERTMTALPVEVDPGPVPAEAAAPPGWTTLRVGLALAWVAALVALSAVGLGGWSLLDLSERRIGFVSAVTHELRTPLTTLRLYLDMLATGLVPPEKQEEYLQTLNTEADRLHRLIGNVLDFSRLENRRPRISPSSILLADVLEQVRCTWEPRCQGANKELVVEAAPPAGWDSNPVAGETSSLASHPAHEGIRLSTDPQIVQQILGNLIENACKYSRGAEDKRIWLRARLEPRKRLVLEVEDRGPGVPQRERRAIFQPFRRGRRVEATWGGVGLGLALAQRWAQALGGKLALRPVKEGGVCFQLELPLVSQSKSS